MNVKKNVKVSIKVKKCDVFPRFFAGNFLSKSIPTVTHTFADNSIVQQRKNRIAFNEKIVKTIKLKPNDSFLISADKDTELKKFVRDELGYIYVKSDTWCQDAFFFSLKGNYIAGDHSF